MDLNSFFKNLKMKTPTVNIQGGRAENRQQINLPNSQPFITTERDRAAGNIGLNFEAPSTVQGQPTVFGVDASGQYMLGQTNFPEELQAYGFPQSQKFGQGLTIDQLSAYLGFPISENVDLNVNAIINPYYVDPVDQQILGKDKFIGANLEYKF